MDQNREYVPFDNEVEIEYHTEKLRFRRKRIIPFRVFFGMIAKYPGITQWYLEATDLKKNKLCQIPMSSIYSWNAYVN